MLKNCLAHLIQWCLAAFIAFLIVNIICFLYDRQPAWMDTPNGVSDAVREPNGLMMHATEGLTHLKKLVKITI